MKTSTSTKLRFTALAIALGLTFGAMGCDDSDDGDATLTVVNDSDFVLDAMFIVRSFESSWGPDVLDGDGLFPGEEITVFDLPCGFYDVRFIDELGAECIQLDVDLCFEDALWFIDNADLAACDGAFGSALKSP